MAKPNTDIAITEIASEDVQKVRSFADAQALFVTAGFSAKDLEYQGSPYKALDDKDVLIGVPFLVTEFKFSESKQYKGPDGVGREFAILYLVTEKDEMYTMTDGSTGIRDQLKAEYARRVEEGHPDPYKGVAAVNGLTRSDYEYVDPTNGNISEASTYYIA